MIQVKQFSVHIVYDAEEKINEILRELQEKGNKILDIKYNEKTGLVMIVYDTNDMLEDIDCKEGKLKWDAKGNLGISGLKNQLSEEIERYYR